MASSPNPISTSTATPQSELISRGTGMRSTAIPLPLRTFSALITRWTDSKRNTYFMGCSENSFLKSPPPSLPPPCKGWRSGRKGGVTSPFYKWFDKLTILSLSKEGIEGDLKYFPLTFYHIFPILFTDILIISYNIGPPFSQTEKKRASSFYLEIWETA